MIKELSINGVSLITDHYFPTRLEGIFAPSIMVKTYNLGSRDGVALGTPYYRNLKVRLDIVVKGDNFSDYVAKRDYLMTIFRFNYNKFQPQTKTLRVKDSSGAVRIADILIADIKGNITPENKTWGTVTVLFETAKEYLRGEDRELTIHLDKGKGWGLPFGIPFAIDQDTGSEISEIVNGGNTESYPTMRVYGDLSGFTIYNSTTSSSLSSGEALGVNDYVDLDFYNRTAVKNGITNILNTISGEWWPLVPGSNQIKLVSSSTSPVAKAVITYHNAYLGL